MVLNQDYIFWVTHAQICAIDLHFKASTRVLDTGMGSIAAVAGVNGQDTLFVVAFLNGSLAVYDAVACTKVWETLEDQRLQDGDGVPLTVRAVVANDSYIVAVTDHSLHLIPYATTISAESPWMKQFDLQLNYVALDGSHVLLHQHDALSISRYHQGDLIKEYISDTESFITSIAYDLDFVPTSFSAAGADFGQHKTVLAGRADGSVDIWFWDDSSPPLTTAKPVRTMKPDFKADPMRVTALAMSDILLFVGYLDGCIQAFDLLTGQLVRIFNDQSTPRHALRQVLLGQADERRYGC